MVGAGMPGITVGAYMCSASLPGTEKSLWEHYNKLRAKLDAKQEVVWHEMTNTTLLIVRFPLSLSNFPVANVQVVRCPCGRPFNIYQLRPARATARRR